MANLNAPMSNEKIERLDYFERIQLYYNVYHDTPYSKLPQVLKQYYLKDDGLEAFKAITLNSDIKNPYEIAKILNAIKPAKPQTLQEVYARAVYLAEICDTTPEKILRSNIFNTQDFIPQLDETVLKQTLSNKGSGLPVTLKEDDYTPTPDTSGDSSGSGSGSDTPAPALTGDYAEETKIYFNVSGSKVTCNTSYNNVLKMLPKLPAAELILGSDSDYQNIADISCGYNDVSGEINFNFIQLYDDVMKLYTIHYKSSGITLEENHLMIILLQWMIIRLFLSKI